MVYMMKLITNVFFLKYFIINYMYRNLIYIKYIHRDFMYRNPSINEKSLNVNFSLREIYNNNKTKVKIL